VISSYSVVSQTLSYGYVNLKNLFKVLTDVRLSGHTRSNVKGLF
jgi:hypothetical protein